VISQSEAIIDINVPTKAKIYAAFKVAQNSFQHLPVHFDGLL